jgi:hypothetical protein
MAFVRATARVTDDVAQVDVVHLNDSVAIAGDAVESPIEKARRERRRALIVPREHGAWGLLLVPMITGAGVAFRHSHNVFPFVLLLTAALALFWLRTPAESLLGTSAIHAENEEERHNVIFVAAYLAAIAVMALGMLLVAGRNPDLWLIGGAVAVAFAAQAFIRRLGRGARMAAQVVGTFGLTAGAPAAYYVITGKFDATAWMLWAVNLIFAGNQIHYVQLRIHTARAQGLRAKLARGWTFSCGQIVMLAVLGLACVRGMMPWIALIAFAPILIRGWLYFFEKPGPLAVRQLGWSELRQAVAFCVLFIAALALTR